MGAVNFLTRVAFASCLILPSFETVARDNLKTSVADLRYGVALYHHYNDDGLLAMSELMVAKAKGGIKGHGDNPDIMEGGFALAYGMDDYAEEIFKRVLEQNRPQEVRDAAWFYLARLRYDKNDWLAADDAAGRISDSPPSYLANELVSLRLSSAVRQNQLDLANEILESQKAKQGWYPYLVFNLASAYARERNYEKALSYYQYFDVEEFKREEHLSLYDKAMTASGYSYLFTDKPELAANQFAKVRLGSPLSSRALLGHGWAKSQTEEYNDALISWQHLSKKSLVDENSQESLVAIPYAYEKLGKPGLALQNFKQAEKRFIDALVQIDNIMANLSDDTMLEVLQIKRSEELDWIIYAEENQLSPQLSYLIRLFSLEEFHNIVHELRDLLAIKEGYAKWQEKITFYDNMLQVREMDRSEKEQLLLAQTLLNKINAIKRQRDALHAQYSQIKGDRNYFELASKNNKNLIKRVEKASQRIERLRETDPFIDESEEAIRRYRGILLWNSAQNFVPKLWELEKKIRVIDKTLKQMRARFESINTIMTVAADLSPHRERFEQSKQKIIIEAEKVDAELQAKQIQLRSKIYEVLEAQRFNVKQYIAQSRLSIARILDEKNKASSGVNLSPSLQENNETVEPVQEQSQ